MLTTLVNYVIPKQYYDMMCKIINKPIVFVEFYVTFQKTVGHLKFQIENCFGRAPV